MKKIMVLHGINLNMFGRRDPAQYGSTTLKEIDEELEKLAAELGVSIECYQTNHEGEMVEKVHQIHEEEVDAVVINAGAWTHYSYGLMDAMAILKVPVIEVHMSQVHSREEFRHFSIFSNIAKGQISGFGVRSYLLGLRVAVDIIMENGKEHS
ncbi:type II 3-dehydroquinate dehydratase [Desulfopila sp. IMCC35008]|uniref:type II 3-dehydroquinate dehydratase n=1 Tax=Desulfopila sp. IMCC35008 TaxID=2653858 RepID=UPI0013CF9237|nr:type II 3-dehydroquinate dehydratase [Desulfopila sp. IMCC35008]